MAIPAAVLLTVLSAAAAASTAGAFQLEIHSRFSPAVLRWAASAGHPGVYAPPVRSPEYYAALVRHDGLLHRSRSRRLLGDGVAQLAFAGGNETYQLSSLGFLYYAMVMLGTPNMTFLVALDTGSDLFWVPCDCQECAPLSSTNGIPSNNYPVSGELSMYSPEQSSTSKTIGCNSGMCTSQHACSAANDSCPYTIQYLSGGTSSSGVLVEDIMYFLNETAQSQVVKAPMVFGCGKTQTGSFLQGAAPNGLLGLGLEDVSVPSLLAKNGVVSNSFSMCFGGDGIGRINFGDQGTSDQQETPFYSNSLTPSYNVSVTGITVGSTTASIGFSAIMDSGTSFTTLADPIYTQITSSFNKQVGDTPQQMDSSVPFQYCYSPRSGGSLSYPKISFTMSGGSTFPINDPIIQLYDQNNILVGYCLAIVNSSNINIIGENFMTGLRVVFDRQRMMLGWKNFNCSHTDYANSLSPSSTGSGIPEATNVPSNHPQISVIQSSSSAQMQMYSRTGSALLAAIIICISISLTYR